MLTLITHELTIDQLYTAVIKGPVGCIEMQELTWIADRQDLLEVYYWSAYAVTQGAYHCCWSLPGKVKLLNS
jgi:hypothetical protein